MTEKTKVEAMRVESLQLVAQTEELRVENNELAGREALLTEELIESKLFIHDLEQSLNNRREEEYVSASQIATAQQQHTVVSASLEKMVETNSSGAKTVAVSVNEYEQEDVAAVQAPLLDEIDVLKKTLSEMRR